MNWGAILGAIICVMMHGGIKFDLVSIFDAITMFIFVYSIIAIKDNNKNTWGCIFSFLFFMECFSIEV